MVDYNNVTLTNLQLKVLDEYFSDPEKKIKNVNLSFIVLTVFMVTLIFLIHFSVQKEHQHTNLYIN